jgi:penicillin-binding protein 2
MRYETISTYRGEILDCNGQKLATNKSLINVYWQGTGYRNLQSHHLDLLKQLENIIPTFSCTDELIRLLHKTERANDRLLICTDIQMEELMRIEEICGMHKNICIQHDTQRYYPHQQTACHIIGYLCNSPHHKSGTMGLEKYLEDTLQGSNGKRIKIINSYGKKICAQEMQRAEHGNTIHATLDITMQHLAEQIFAPPHEGTFILMDPVDGAIKALVSLPNFDPTIFLSPLSSASWQKIQDQKPFLNKAIQCTYAPGSLFKLITAGAGLEHNLIAPHDTFTCSGSLTFGDRINHCNNRKGHGKMSVMQALAHSCNILFYRLGIQLSVDTIADYAARFGLGIPTGFLFPEKSGLIPTAAWKYNTKNEQWWPGETLSVAIGQSFVSVTPLQIARMISSIFTGYLVKPRIHTYEKIETQPLHIKPETLDFLQHSMISVVTEGTGRQIRTIKDITVYAKTGTAQVTALQKNNHTHKYREHGWFTAYFTCKEKAPLVMVILVEHAGSSRIPTHLAKEFLLKYSTL